MTVDGLARPTTYLDPTSLPYPFCPGCSHSTVVDQLDHALVRLGLDPSRVVVVSDIGCAGMADRFLATHAFHGLHGRSITYATGIKAARPDLHVIVLIGDGGCGIGGHHLIGAARRNVGITVIVFNNFNFGMTGGQHSVTTPESALTATTPLGNLERPLDVAALAAATGASYAARASAYDPSLPEIMASAIATDGFALVDVWEMCTAYYVPRNDLNRRAIEEAMAAFGVGAGVVHTDVRPEYTRAYRDAAAGVAGRDPLPPRPLPTLFRPVLASPLRISLAGSAGQRVRTAGTLLAAAGVIGGLWASRRDDYPITVRTGFSLADVTLAPEPIGYTGAPVPDVAVVLAPEGAARIAPALARMGRDARVYVAEGVPPPRTPARVMPLEIPSAARPHARRLLSTLAAVRVVLDLEPFPVAALREAALRVLAPDVAAANTAAIDAMSATEG